MHLKVMQFMRESDKEKVIIFLLKYFTIKEFERCVQVTMQHTQISKDRFLKIIVSKHILH